MDVSQRIAENIRAIAARQPLLPAGRYEAIAEAVQNAHAMGDTGAAMMPIMDAAAFALVDTKIDGVLLGQAVADGEVTAMQALTAAVQSIMSTAIRAQDIGIGRMPGGQPALTVKATELTVTMIGHLTMAGFKIVYDPHPDILANYEKLSEAVLSALDEEIAGLPASGTC